VKSGAAGPSSFAFVEDVEVSEADAPVEDELAEDVSVESSLDTDDELVSEALPGSTVVPLQAAANKANTAIIRTMRFMGVTLPPESLYEDDHRNEIAASST